MERSRIKVIGTFGIVGALIGLFGGTISHFLFDHHIDPFQAAASGSSTAMVLAFFATGEDRTDAR